MCEGGGLTILPGYQSDYTDALWGLAFIIEYIYADRGIQMYFFTSCISLFWFSEVDRRRVLRA